MSKEKAREYFEKGCNEYLRLFCEKHEFDFEDAKGSWVGNDIGGVVNVADYYVDMQTIIDDIELDAPEEEFYKWHDYTLDANEFNLPLPNFRNWVKGCPRTSAETFEKLREIKRTLEECIAKEKNKNSV